MTNLENYQSSCVKWVMYIGAYKHPILDVIDTFKVCQIVLVLWTIGYDLEIPLK